MYFVCLGVCFLFVSKSAELSKFCMGPPWPPWSLIWMLRVTNYKKLPSTFLTLVKLFYNCFVEEKIAERLSNNWRRLAWSALDHCLINLNKYFYILINYLSNFSCLYFLEVLQVFIYFHLMPGFHDFIQNISCFHNTCGFGYLNKQY